MARLLIVDDEQDICEILKFHLEESGYTVDTAGSAEEALCMRIADYDLLLLDVMMEGMSGFSLASRLKKEPATAHIPIIFVTAKDSENDILHGFNLGADDYISKPFHLGEVAARVKAVLRRSMAGERNNAERAGSHIRCGALEIDTTTKTAMLHEQPMVLTRKEYDLLVFLMSNKGQFFGREQLLDNVWRNDANVLERSVDVTIFRLRKKLKEYAGHIVSRSGYGYGFKE